MALPTTHLATSLLLGRLLGLEGVEWIKALGFGVLVDIDHFFSLNRDLNYIRYRLIPKALETLPILKKTQFLARISKGAKEKLKHRFNRFFQFPLLLIPAGIYGWLFNDYVPAIFLGLHIGLDLLLKTEQRLLWPVCKKSFYKGFWPSMTKLELKISFVMVAIIFFIVLFTPL